MINTGIPILGLAEVVKTILDNIFRNTLGGDWTMERWRNALAEWRRDLEMILHRYTDAPELKNPDLRKYISEMIDTLDRYGIKE